MKIAQNIWAKAFVCFALLGFAGGNAGAAPTLESSYPTDGTTSVLAITPLVLTFSEDMEEQQSIAWSSNIDPSKITYTWEGATTLMISYNVGSFGFGTWPANATVTWVLNPSAADANFRSVAGEQLPIAQYSGAFSTGTTISTNGSGGNTNVPCQSQALGNVFSVYKFLYYNQTGPGTVVIDPEVEPTFGASVSVPTTANMTAAKLTIPGSGAVDLDILANPFSTNTTAYKYDTKPTQAQLDQAYPAGNYSLQVTAGGSHTASVSLTSAYPNTPQISNYPQTQTIDPNAPFTFQWNAFAGAGAHDGISLTITDTNVGGEGVVFSAPDECATPKIELAVTATSITIPKGTLSTGKNYELRLGFYHTIDYNVPLMTGVTGNSALSKNTVMNIKTTGGTVSLTAPKFAQAHRVANGMVEFQLTCMAQRSVVIESTTDFKSWSQVLTTNAPSATLTVDLPAGPKTFFRAQQQ